jgi:DNA/RNA endonuclease YhcR with UshA esterase domain
VSQEPPSPFDPGVQCAGCGRFVGAEERCPYCGTRVHKRLGVRVVRYGAIVLAVAGLFAVWMVARSSDVPVVRISDVGGTMNWAFVQVGGIVTRYPTYDQESGALQFWIDDGTGEIMVLADRAESATLASAGKVPALGDRVTVVGTLRVKDDFQYLVVELAEKMSVEPIEPAQYAVGEIVAGQVRQKVLVQGQVREVRAPYEGLVILAIHDGTGSIDLTYDDDLVRLSGQPVQVVPGDTVSARGMVTLYRGTAQIALDDAAGLQRLPEEIEVAISKGIGDIGLQDVDRLVRVQGVVARQQSISGGQKYVLDDGSGTITLLLWNDLLDGWPSASALREGAWVDAQGIVSEYRGELELVPELACDLRAVQDRPEPAVPTPGPGTTSTAAPTAVPTSTTEPLPTATAMPADTPTPARSPTSTHTPVPAPTSTATWTPTATPLPPPTWTPTSAIQFVSTGQVALASLGQVVRVEGQIVEVVPFTSGTRFYVDDGSGRLVVWIVRDVLAQMPDTAGWAIGSTVQAAGVVQEYNGEIELVPQAAGDVRVIAAATPPPKTISRIADLSAADKDRRVTVEGTIVEVTPFSAGVKYLLDDGSGRIMLLLWQEVYDALADRERLAPGVRVQATGTIDEYRGELEVIPGVESDLVIQ